MFYVDVFYEVSFRFRVGSSANAFKKINKTLKYYIVPSCGIGVKKYKKQNN